MTSLAADGYNANILAIDPAGAAERSTCSAHAASELFYLWGPGRPRQRAVRPAAKGVEVGGYGGARRQRLRALVRRARRAAELRGRRRPDEPAERENGDERRLHGRAVHRGKTGHLIPVPDPPEGEAQLRELAAEFVRAEGYVFAMLAEAVTGDRRRAAQQALERLASLRRLDHSGPVLAAYLYENPWGLPDAVDDLAAALALRLDRGATTASDGAKDAFRRVSKETLDEVLASPLTAAVDRAGRRWGLGAWGEVHCSTYGRHSTSRGVAHAIGDGGRFIVNVGQCELCHQLFGGGGIVGESPMPPGHPGCSCTVAPA